MADKNTSAQNFLQTIALTALWAGAVVSLYCMFQAGSNQKSRILIGLFTAWILSPFLALFIANRLTSAWQVPKRRLLYWLMICLSMVSPIAYSGLVTIPNAKPAFIFLVFPLVSWITLLLFFSVVKGHKQKK